MPISPDAFGDFRQDGDCLLVNLTREEIEATCEQSYTNATVTRSLQYVGKQSI